VADKGRAAREESDARAPAPPHGRAGCTGDATSATSLLIRRPGLDVFRTFNEVGLAVTKATGGAQQATVMQLPLKLRGRHRKVCLNAITARCDQDGDAPWLRSGRLNEMAATRRRGRTDGPWKASRSNLSRAGPTTTMLIQILSLPSNESHSNGTENQHNIGQKVTACITLRIDGAA
jgi:hypothetical protein